MRRGNYIPDKIKKDHIIDKEIAAASLGPTADQATILGALQGHHVYGGTVPAATVAKRRAKNKVAKASRKRNRS